MTVSEMLQILLHNPYDIMCHQLKKRVIKVFIYYVVEVTQSHFGHEISKL